MNANTNANNASSSSSAAVSPAVYQCQICKEDIDTKVDDYTLLPCAHKMHAECYHGFFDGEYECPECKTLIPLSSVEDILAPPPMEVEYMTESDEAYEPSYMTESDEAYEPSYMTESDEAYEPSYMTESDEAYDPSYMTESDEAYEPSPPYRVEEPYSPVSSVPDLVSPVSPVSPVAPVAPVAPAQENRVVLVAPVAPHPEDMQVVESHGRRFLECDFMMPSTSVSSVASLPSLIRKKLEMERKSPMRLTARLVGGRSRECVNLIQKNRRLNGQIRGIHRRMADLNSQRIWDDAYTTLLEEVEQTKLLIKHDRF